MSAWRKVESTVGDIYEVFAKVKAEDEFRHIGNVVASDANLARVYAFTVYQEWAWSEMFVVPRRVIVPIIALA
jgi:1,2-phenylacetyl-CoA epoxidase PaaB subunit